MRKIIFAEDMEIYNYFPTLRERKIEAALPWVSLVVGCIALSYFAVSYVQYVAR